ncbi:MAG: adenosylmethionine decarboxylase [Nitrososphaerota archaeon]
MRGGSRAGHPVYNSKGVGRHLIVDLYGCDPHILSDEKPLIRILTEAANHSGATIVGRYAEKFDKGGGVSAIVVIKESHISLHTWPELGYASLDIFTCGDSVDPWKAYEYIIRKIRPFKVGAFEVIRGQNVLIDLSLSLHTEAEEQRGG